MTEGIMNFASETQLLQEISDLWARVNQCKPQLAECDQVILKQQARIVALSNYLSAMGYELNTDDAACLEAALKAERIKTLEDLEYVVRSRQNRLTN